MYFLHILPHTRGKMEMTLNFKTVMTLGSKGKLKWKLYREGYSTVSVIFPLKKKTQNREQNGNYLKNLGHVCV